MRHVLVLGGFKKKQPALLTEAWKEMILEGTMKRLPLDGRWDGRGPMCKTPTQASCLCQEQRCQKTREQEDDGKRDRLGKEAGQAESSLGHQVKASCFL